jgi:hypothetical protein
MGEIYTEDFYDAEWLNARPSVCVIEPLLLELIQRIRSVIDLGCGRGEWPAVLKRYFLKALSRNSLIDRQTRANHKPDPRRRIS